MHACRAYVGARTRLVVFVSLWCFFFSFLLSSLSFRSLRFFCVCSFFRRLAVPYVRTRTHTHKHDLGVWLWPRVCVCLCICVGFPFHMKRQRIMGQFKCRHTHTSAFTCVCSTCSLAGSLVRLLDAVSRARLWFIWNERCKAYIEWIVKKKRWKKRCVYIQTHDINIKRTWVGYILCSP